MTAKQLIKLIESIGYYEIRQTGSHKTFWHDARKNHITIPVHTGKDLKPGTLNKILKDAGLK